MKRLGKKLHSEDGASLLLALLMLLVCMLVAASIAAAAASNAGKYRSNRVEQQKYLVLSSAIRLVANEIEKAEYTGSYKIYEWDDKYHIEQVAGDYSCGEKRGGATEGELTAQLPLGKELDEIFSKQFTGTGYTALTAGLEPSTPRTLTVTLPDALSTYPDSGNAPYTVERVVTVQVTLDHNTRHIRLIAWPGNGGFPDAKEVMSAELAAKGSLAVDYNPGVRTAAALDPAAASSTGSTSAIGWELYWIRKGVA